MTRAIHFSIEENTTEVKTKEMEGTVSQQVQPVHSQVRKIKQEEEKAKEQLRQSIALETRPVLREISRQLSASRFSQVRPVGIGRAISVAD
ncbi:hypothetical protein FCM35_KLT11642 [Carex littledalei]|uniref:Uncharacterized protein n=1 Tax=Carex littledalei TaxID=544730 RepID=A0A833QC29_9POAL|nr:hypothetical protein FCM35_KLT11642 [Carex littledalei]